MYTVIFGNWVFPLGHFAYIYILFYIWEFVNEFNRMKMNEVFLFNFLGNYLKNMARVQCISALNTLGYGHVSKIEHMSVSLRVQCN